MIRTQSITLLLYCAALSSLALSSDSARSKLATLHDIVESCKPSGLIEDACCEYKTIEQVNDEIAPFLDDLVKTSFFRYVKIDLNRGCNFWKEDHFCFQEGCAVEPADEAEIPESLRSAALSSVDYNLATDSSFPQFVKKCAFNDHDFCALDDPLGLHEIPYVNLLKNPERFTGYAGDSAARVWGAIYNENCFAEDKGATLDTVMNRGGGDGGNDNGVCKEKRVFYRLVSGLHSSISTHICDQWMDQKTGTWERNLECFKYRLGMFPDRIQNMYFTYVVLLRSITKLGPYLQSNTWCSSTSDAKKIKRLVSGMIEKTLSCPPTFDERALFTDSASAVLKDEFKEHFRNISLIMDCVGCEKCRLWGKLQVTGLGTALKILFSFGDDPSQYYLTQTEVISLINGFHRISNSLRAVERFRNRVKDQEEILRDVTAPTEADTTGAVSPAVKNARLLPSASANFSFSYVSWNDPQALVRLGVGLLFFVCGAVILLKSAWTRNFSNNSGKTEPGKKKYQKKEKMARNF
ncbi:hypothetical protein HK100_001892 [Physocladia obscura]|uniref:Uncharacterized protein n=1 Tax=Physocladia obscura TaxID=109957 RepID=A0AAD5SWH0_9FUNG|nr:hypothetical protein HK100_001892 [Physocladia obscura]